MAHLPPSAQGTSNYERVMGHAPHVLAAWSALEDTFFNRSVLPKPLLEELRKTLAGSHGCAYCQAKGGPPSLTHAEVRTSLAVGLAQVYAADHAGIDGKMLQVLGEHFSHEELVELVAFMGFMWAGGTFGKVFDIQP